MDWLPIERFGLSRWVWRKLLLEISGKLAKYLYFFNKQFPKIVFLWKNLWFKAPKFNRDLKKKTDLVQKPVAVSDHFKQKSIGHKSVDSYSE